MGGAQASQSRCSISRNREHGHQHLGLATIHGHTTLGIEVIFCWGFPHQEGRRKEPWGSECSQNPEGEEVGLLSPSLSYQHSAEGSRQERERDRRGGDTVNTRPPPQPAELFSFLGFHSTSTPPPPAKRAKQKKAKAEETEVLFLAWEKFSMNCLFVCVCGGKAAPRGERQAVAEPLGSPALRRHPPQGISKLQHHRAHTAGTSAQGWQSRFRINNECRVANRFSVTKSDSRGVTAAWDAGSAGLQSRHPVPLLGRASSSAPQSPQSLL